MSDKRYSEADAREVAHKFLGRCVSQCATIHTEECDQLTHVIEARVQAAAAEMRERCAKQRNELRALWMERAKKLRKDGSYTDCAVTLESCADDLSSLRALPLPTEALDALIGAAYEKCAQFVRDNVPYLPGVGSISVTMAEHIRSKFTLASARKALDLAVLRGRLEEAKWWAKEGDRHYCGTVPCESCTNRYRDLESQIAEKERQ